MTDAAEKVTTVEVANALLLPVRLDAEAGLGMALPAFDADGKPLASVVLRRHYGRTGTGVPEPGREALAGTHIYGGFLNPHFGHFLLTSPLLGWSGRNFSGSSPPQLLLS